MNLNRKRIVVLVIICFLFVLIAGDLIYKRYIRIQNIFDQMYYTRIRTHYDWWGGVMGGFGNKDDCFSKMPQMEKTSRDTESCYTSDGEFVDHYEVKYLKEGERLFIDTSRNEKILRINAEIHFDKFEIDYWYKYDVRTKELKEMIGYYAGDKGSRDTQKVIMLAEKAGLTEKDLVQYKKYFLYDKFLTDWLAVNNSRFSIDHWGNVNFIEALPPISTLNDNG